MAQHKLVQYDSMAASMTLGPMDAGTQRMVMGALAWGAIRRIAAIFKKS